MSRSVTRGTLLVVAVFCIAGMTLPAAAASGDTTSATNSTVSTLSQSTADSVIGAQSSNGGSSGERIIGYKYIDLENKEVYRFGETPDLSSLPNGEYTEIRTVQTAEGTEERTQTVEVDDGQSSSISSASHNSPYRLDVLHDHSEYEASYNTGSTVDLWIGAGNENGTTGNTDVTVTISTPSGDEVEFNRTLGADGNTELSYDTSGGTNGVYDVYVESADGNEVSGYGEFRVGPQIKEIFPSWTETTTVGNEVSASLFLTEDAKPVPNTQTSVTLRKPDGSTETKSVTTDAEGIGRFSFTPTQSGSYSIRADNYHEYFNIEASEYAGRLYVNGDGADARPGTTVGLSGTVIDADGPAAQQSVSIVLLKDNNEPVANLSATTDAAGTFYTEWQAPDDIDERTSYGVEFQTSDGTQIATDYTDVTIEPPQQPDEGDAEPLDVNVETAQYATPGDTLDLQIDAERGDEAFANKEITILPSVDYGDVAIDVLTVETDSSGTATAQYTIPEVPDGTRIEFNADADVEGNIDAYDDVNIQQYKIEEDWSYEAEPGDTATYSISVTDVETGDPVSGFPMMLAPEREFGHASVYDSQTIQTNGSGMASAKIFIPADAGGEHYLGSFAKYDPSNYFTSTDINTFDAGLAGIDDFEYAAGKTLSLNYDGPSGTSAILGVTTYSSDAPTPLATTRVSAGEQFSFTIPRDAPQGTYYEIQGFAVNSDGNTQRLSEYIQVEGTTGKSVRLRPASLSTSPSSSATTDVVVDDIDNGVAAYDFNLTISNASVATIDTIELAGEPGVQDVTISDDGSSASVSASLADTPDSGTVKISDITFSTANKGSAEINLEVNALGDESGSSYQLGTVEDGTIEVGVELPAVVGDSAPADPNGDGAYEDVNGDGAVNVVDVQALFSNLDSEAIKNNPEAFDYNNDGSVNVVDVQALFNQL